MTDRILPYWLPAQGEEVAVLPRPEAPPSDILEIVSVAYVGEIFIQLADGRVYSAAGGRCVGGDGRSSYIVAATDEHRAAMAAKSVMRP